MSFNVGDVVRINPPPKGCQRFNWPGLVGYAGVVEMAGGLQDIVLVQSFTLDGELHRLANIPGAALELETSPQWAMAAVKYKRWVETLDRDVEDVMRCRARRIQ